jgi:hypothetical protein
VVTVKGTTLIKVGHRLVASPRDPRFNRAMRPQKITLVEMRSGGILVYCADYRCSRSIAMSADQWPDDVRLSSNAAFCRAAVPTGCP